MNHNAAPSALAFALLACALIAGCAAPGDPVARHPVVPTAVADLGARQYGSAFVLAFTLPTRSLDRQALAEHPSIEIYRAELPPGSVPDKQTAWQLAYTVPSEQVETYLRGNRVEFHDPLAPDEFSRAAGSSLAYKIRTREARARESADSNMVTERIYPAPEAPRDVRINVTATAVTLSWAEAAMPPSASARVYRVYRGVSEGSVENLPRDISQVKLKSPLELAGSSSTTEFRDVHFEFGTDYVYTVRSAAQFGATFVESADSAPIVLTPREIFPPAAPTNLELTVMPATPQAAAYVELSWEISSEADLAGYSVYRSDVADSPGERVSTEILPSPTFRDTSVASGKHYFYRVSAVDQAGNESSKSSAAEADIP
ncbi:MAG TPA: hypothetical protein VH161_04830 [Candidatus Acidoferrales bacterium]|jgi:hypothetical protein|nr:hypothetical protein [Candidatus Acidoferrales bacterium]